MSPSLPEALNQHPIGISDVIEFIGFGVVLAALIYGGMFWTFWVYSRLFKRPYSIRTINKAAAVCGLSFALFVPMMYITMIIPGKFGESVELGSMIVIVLSAFIVVIRTLWKGES